MDSKTSGRFGVVASAGSGSQGLLGAEAWELGQPIHVRREKGKKQETKLKIDRQDKMPVQFSTAPAWATLCIVNSNIPSSSCPLSYCDASRM